MNSALIRPAFREIDTKAAFSRINAEKFDGLVRVSWEPVKSDRSLAQCRYLNGVAYKLLGEATGYERDDISEFCCGTYFGWKQVKVPKTPSNPEGVEDRPLRTTTTDENGKRNVLSKVNFMDYIAWVQRFAASKGVHIPDPNEGEM